MLAILDFRNSEEHKLKFYSFSSSSRGNCYYLSGQSDAVLLDSGISARKIETTLAQIDTNTPLRGILLTHEHIDHIKSINTLVKHLQIPVFATKGTWAALEKENCTVPQKLRVDLSGQSSLHLGDLTIRWHNTSHDSLEPVFYTIEENTRTQTVVVNPNDTQTLHFVRFVPWQSAWKHATKQGRFRRIWTLCLIRQGQNLPDPVWRVTKTLNLRRADL